MESLYSYGGIEQGSEFEPAMPEGSSSLLGEALEGMGDFISQHKLEAVLIVGGTALAAVASRGKILKNIGRVADDVAEFGPKAKPWEMRSGIKSGVQYMESRSSGIAPLSNARNPVYAILKSSPLEPHVKVSDEMALSIRKLAMTGNPELKAKIDALRNIPDFRPGAKVFEAQGNPLRKYDQSGFRFVPTRMSENPLRTYDQSRYLWIPPRSIK